MHVVPFMALSFPLGDATDAPADSLAGRYSWQWMPLEIGLGAKPIENLYVGGYFNVTVGFEGSDLHTRGRCEAGNDVEDDVSCSSHSVHAGIELRYTFTPAESLSGWVGYGAGVTSATQSISDAGHYSEETTAKGYDFGRISGGLDVRVTRGFGFGPYAVATIGRFTSQSTEIRNRDTFSGDVDDQTMHTWLSLGMRLVVFP